MVLLRVIKYLVGCVVRLCEELNQNMLSWKMLKYRVLQES
ncbi:uncharacterized protein LOC129242546 [Anastrepha obliqua]|nr:uncharacterized protein LOC128861390 [Anastrepha ludens]XP_054735217.1 uncharacterized protein LOC129242546 [Anastrepha obliqua]